MAEDKKEEKEEKEIDVEDEFEDYYEEDEKPKEEKAETKAKSAKKKKTKKKKEKEPKKEDDEGEIDLSENDDLDAGNDQNSPKTGMVKYLTVLVLGALIMLGIIYFMGFLHGPVECPQCEDCPGADALECPECPDCEEVNCPALTSERCEKLFNCVVA